MTNMQMQVLLDAINRMPGVADGRLTTVTKAVETLRAAGDMKGLRKLHDHLQNGFQCMEHFAGSFGHGDERQSAEKDIPICQHIYAKTPEGFENWSGALLNAFSPGGFEGFIGEVFKKRKLPGIPDLRVLVEEVMKTITTAEATQYAQMIERESR